MKCFSQTGAVVILSSIMNREDNHEKASPDTHGAAADHPAAAGQSTGESRDPAAPQSAQPDGEQKVSFLLQLLKNLYCGLRIALSLRVQAGQLSATPAALSALALTDLLLNLIVSLLLVGSGGYLSYSAFPSFFFHLPLLLFFGFLAGRIFHHPSLVTALPVALVALSVPIELCHALLERMAQLRQFSWLEDYLVATHYYRFFWWWAATAFFFLLRLGARGARLSAVLLLFLALVAAPLWLFPRGDLWVSSSESESGELHLTEDVLTAQARLLDAELKGLLPGKKGVTDLYFVGLAGDAGQDVFLKELRAAGRLFSTRFRSSGRKVLLANNPQTAVTLPFATADNLERTLSRVGEVMNRDEDLLFLFLTSHGTSEHELALSNRPLELEGLRPETLARMLKKSGITWKVVVVSACYAGGFIEPLRDDQSLLITAADESHESFGCGYGEEFTWFGRAFLDESLRATFSFTAAFEMAREKIRQWEEDRGEIPSNPQISLGKAMGEKLRLLEKQLAGRGSSQAVRPGDR